MEGMGALSALDFAATLEGAIEYYGNLASDYSASKSSDYSTARNDHKASEMIRILEESVSLDWTEQVSRQDPRFASLFPPGHGTLQELIDKILSEPDSLGNIAHIPRLVDCIQKIEQYIAVSENEPLEECLVAFLRSLYRTDEKRLKALATRLGWNGEKPATLEECGKRLNITRERVRQIQSNIVRRIPEHPVLMPKLDHALAVLEKAAPVTLRVAARILEKKGVTNKEFHPYGLLEAAQLLHRQTTLKICETRGKKMVISEPQTEAIQLVPRIARKLAGQSGISSIFQVMDSSSSEGVDCDETQVRKILSSFKDFAFLDTQWFWATDIKGNRNRLYNMTRKMLAVASPQSLASIRGGLRRQYRYRRISHARYKTLTVPPLAVMKVFYNEHPDFRLEGEMLFSEEPLDYMQILGDAERTFVEVLRQSPSGLLDRKSFAYTCLAKGVNENTFNVFTTYSSVLEHVGTDIWKLRGVSVDPAAVEAVRTANQLKPKEKRVLQYGWNDDGKLWIAARIPALPGSMVVGCPGPIQRFLNGQEFTCITKDGERNCGTVSVNDSGASYGYSTFIRRYGLDEDDILLTEFDLTDQTATLSMVDEDILYEDST